MMSKLANKMARANIVRLVLLLALFIFAFLFIQKLSYKAVVFIQMPSELERGGPKKIMAAAEFRVMQSREVVKSSLKNALHLSGTREVAIDADMVDRIKKNLYYKYDPESLSFELEYFDRSKEYAVKIANAIAEAYILDYSSKLNDITSKTLQMMYMKQLDAEKTLSSANSRYEKFCSEENIISLENDYALLSSQYTQHSGELAKLNAEISIAEKLAEKNMIYRPKPSSAAYSLPARETGAAPETRMEESEENYELKKKIRDSEIRLAMLKRKYTNVHPLVKNEAALLDILRNKITYRTELAGALKTSAPEPKPAMPGRNDQAIELLKTRRNAYISLINQCEAQIKSYPKKKSQIKSYEVEIAKLENILTAINKHIDATRISQTELSDNMPRIIEASNGARINIAYFDLSAALLSLFLFLMSFKVEAKALLLKENRKLANYKNVVADDFKFKVLGHVNKGESLNFEDPSFSASCFAYHQKDSRQSRHVGTIRNNITGQLDRNTGVAFGLTSLNPSEGKTVLAANIGISAALGGQQTLVVDFNYKTTCPPVAEYYKASNDYGITDIVVGETPYEEVLSATAIEDLKLISTGMFPPNVHKVVSSPVCGEFIKQVSERFGLVVADCPAFSISSDFHAVAGYIKNLVLVIDVEKISSIDDFRDEIAAFDIFAKSANLHVLGVIFNEK